MCCLDSQVSCGSRNSSLLVEIDMETMLNLNWFKLLVSLDLFPRQISRLLLIFVVLLTCPGKIMATLATLTSDIKPFLDPAALGI